MDYIVINYKGLKTSLIRITKEESIEARKRFPNVHIAITSRGKTYTYFEGRTMKPGESFTVSVTAKKSDASKYKTIKVEDFDLDYISQPDVTLTDSPTRSKMLITCAPMCG